MRIHRTRSSDSTFDLNLAPVLDIIVSIVPMLLLSVAFVQIKMIEAPTTQVVMDQKVNPQVKPETSITLKVSKKTGFEFNILDAKGVATKSNVALRGGEFDFQTLLINAIRIKQSHPEITRIQLEPELDISFDDIVKVMDQIRQKPQVKSAASISETAAAKPVQNEYLFPDVIFSSVGG